MGLKEGLFFNRSYFYLMSSSRKAIFFQLGKAVDGQTGSLHLAAMFAQIGQGLVVQQEVATRILKAMKWTTRSAITGIPIPEFGGEATESPKIWLRDVRQYLQATFADDNPDLGATLGIALKGAARE